MGGVLLERRPASRDPVGLRPERWATQEAKREAKCVHPDDRVAGDELAFELGLMDTPPPRLLNDLDELVRYERLKWAKHNRQLASSGLPTALQGGFAGFPNVPPAAALGTVTSASGTVALFTSSLHAPISANAIQSPQGYRFALQSLSTTSTSPANLGFDPRIGTGSTINTTISGTTLGASTNVALTASITNSFALVWGDVTVRAIAGPGANSTVYAFLTYFGTQATSSGLAGPAVIGAGHQLLFGGTVATVDLSIAAGFSLGVVHTVSTITYVVQGIHWTSWN